MDCPITGVMIDNPTSDSPDGVNVKLSDIRCTLQWCTSMRYECLKFVTVG